MALFTKQKIFTATEMHSRHQILTDNYCKVLQIEAQTMLNMIRRQILPAVSAYIKQVVETALAQKRAFLP